MKIIKPNTEKGPTETNRLETFSDGVFAISITLLVLELIQFLHPQNNQHVLNSLLDNWEPLLAFSIGFITILICWINHHHAFDYIIKVDGKFMWVNGFLLFMITLTPFPTAILAGFLRTEGKIALAIYGFNYFLIALAAYCICAYAYNNHLIKGSSRRIFNYLRLMYKYSLVYTFLAFLVCFISIPIAIGLYVILFLVFAFPKEFVERISKGQK